MTNEFVDAFMESIFLAVQNCVENFFTTSGNKEDVQKILKENNFGTKTPALKSSEPTTPYSYQYMDTPSEKCKAVYTSKRVLTSILAEAYANGDNETGGPFFGHAEEDGNWYIIETSEPGYGALHTPVNHEFSNRYVNYRYRALSRIYAKPLTLVGFWHRHPGSFNRFSGLDDVVNTSYAEAIGNGTISILLNFTAAGPRFTCYYLDPDDGCYHRTPLIVDSKILAKKGFLNYATPAELAERAEDMQEAMEGVA